MKQLFILLFVTLAFFGCSSKNENPQPKDTVLLKTKWQTQDLAAEIVWGGRWFRVIHFTSNTDFEVYKTKNGSIDSYVSEGTYAITDQKVTLSDKDSKGKVTVTNYTMVNSGTLECESKGQYYCTYVKQ